MVSGSRAKGRRRSAVDEAKKDRAIAASEAILRERARGFDGDIADLAGEVAAKPELLIRILASRSYKRAAEHSVRAELMPAFGWRCGYAIAAADQVLHSLNAPWDLPDRDLPIETQWLAELRRGLDTYARIGWCLRFGYSVAAAALARVYIERWTYNIAFSTDTWKLVGEDDAAYLDRIWGTFKQGTELLRVGQQWSDLSEWLHGRPVEISGSSVHLGSAATTLGRARAHNFIARAAEVPLRQVRGGINVAAKERGAVESEIDYALQAPIVGFPKEVMAPDFLSVFYEPLEYDFVTSERGLTCSEWGATYRRIISNRDGVPVNSVANFQCWMAIEERWSRAIDRARAAFVSEEALFGERFDSRNLEVTILQYRTISEMADIAASSVSNHEQQCAIQSAAAALESAWVLWLQDVDESLVCMRMVLECTARARTHRLKPDKAKRMEARNSPPTPHRWVEAAGWGRLSVFLRALGEFSHVQERSRHTGSRLLLTEIQRNALEDNAASTARARALEEVAMMLAHEVAATVQGIDAALADRFREQILSRDSIDTETDLAEWLERAHGFRDHMFGEADFDRDRSIPTSPDNLGS